MLPKKSCFETRNSLFSKTYEQVMAGERVLIVFVISLKIKDVFANFYF